MFFQRYASSGRSELRGGLWMSGRSWSGGSSESILGMVCVQSKYLTVMFVGGLLRRMNVLIYGLILGTGYEPFLDLVRIGRCFTGRQRECYLNEDGGKDMELRTTKSR